MERRDFIKKSGIAGIGAVLSQEVPFSQSQEIIPRTQLVPTAEKFKNGELVYTLLSEGRQRIGEFWPVRGLNLVTKDTDPEVFKGDIKDIHRRLGAVATAPDGLTGGSVGRYKLEGKSLSNGRPCGDGVVKDYGIIVVEGGFKIEFTHTREHEGNFDALYNSVRDSKGSLFFLPSVYRNGRYLSSNNILDKVLVRRETPGSEQIGVVLFDSSLNYDQARRAILGLDRANQSKTTHIYYLDGGNKWGQSAKEVNGEIVTKGSRDPEVITNYLILY